MNKYDKGEYGYLNAYNREKLIITLVLAAMIEIIVISLMLKFGDTKRVFVVFAILLALPFAKFFIAFAMSFKFKPLTKEQYDKIISNKNENGNYLFDLMVSQYEGIRFFQSVCVINNNIFGLALGKKYPLEKKEYEKWLKQSFADSKYEYNVTIAGDVDEYISLISNTEEPDDKEKLIDKHITERILDIGV